MKQYHPDHPRLYEVKPTHRRRQYRCDCASDQTCIFTARWDKSAGLLFETSEFVDRGMDIPKPGEVFRIGSVSRWRDDDWGGTGKPADVVEIESIERVEAA